MEDFDSFPPIQPSIDDAKKMIATYNKMLKKSKNPIEKAY